VSKEKNKLLSRKTHGDFALLIAVCLLAITGTVFIYSASNYSALATYGDGFYFVKKQAIGIALGINVYVQRRQEN